MNEYLPLIGILLHVWAVFSYMWLEDKREDKYLFGVEYRLGVLFWTPFVLIVAFWILAIVG